MRRFNWKGFKDGWSPTMITLKAQLQALQTMLRHLTGRNKHYKWQTTLEASTSIKEITDHWEATVFSLKWADKQDAYKIMDTGGRGPSYWRTLEGYPKLVELVSEIERIKKKLHGRQRTELRILINSAVAARELSREKGKLSLYLRALLGERRASFSFDCLQLNEDTLLTNALEIHQQLTEITINSINLLTYKTVVCIICLMTGTGSALIKPNS